MATANEVIAAALQFLEVNGVNDSLSADDAALGLTELNDFLAALNTRGGFYAGGTLTLSSVVPLPDELIAHLKRAFAMSLAPFFDMAMTPMKASLAMKADKLLIASLHQVQLARVDRALQNMPSTSNWYRNY